MAFGAMCLVGFARVRFLFDRNSDASCDSSARGGGHARASATRSCCLGRSGGRAVCRPAVTCVECAGRTGTCWCGSLGAAGAPDAVSGERLAAREWRLADG
eukprot:3612320-Prymnesium_polylepis.1